MNPQIQIGLDFLIGHDRYLLEKGASERSITHRLGLYYQHIFPDWDVDCEFNLNLGGPKEINIKPKEFLGRMAETLKENYGADQAFTILENEHISYEDVQALQAQLENPKIEVNKEFDVTLHVLKLRDKNGKKVTVKKQIYPDIIIHERETNNNLVVMEAKKTSNSVPSARVYDIIKLECLTKPPFNYQNAYFVDLPVKREYIKHRKFVFAPPRRNGIVEVSSTK